MVEDPSGDAGDLEGVAPQRADTGDADDALDAVGSEGVAPELLELLVQGRVVMADAHATMAVVDAQLRRGAAYRALPSDEQPS